MKTIIFLGAGASKSEGAPLQDELFLEYFKEFSTGHNKYYDLLEDFFKKTYNINVKHTKQFPSFEEILGLLYIAEKRRESFYFNIDEIKQSIILSMAEILDTKFINTSNNHYQFIHNLHNCDLLKDLIFITTNYDYFIDSAILSNQLNIDYGFKDFHQHKETFSLPLYKVYGSLNWRYCDVCDQFIISPVEKSVLNNFKNEDFNCKVCNNQFKTIIIPPTFYKEISNYYLNNIYHNVNKSLYEVNHIIFCGYSFPDADLYIKFILKRAEIYKQSPFKVTIINNYKGKSKDKMELEKRKYNLFFKDEVHYEEISFQDFIGHAQQFLI